MFDQHNIASSVYFSVKAIVSTLTSFISGTSASYRIFQSYFRSNIAASKTSVLGAPSQDGARQTDYLTYALKKLVLDVLLAAFLKKRIATLGTTEKRLQVLKVTHYFFFSVVLTFRSSFCVSDIVREVSFFQRQRGKEEWNGPWGH